MAIRDMFNNINLGNFFHLANRSRLAILHKNKVVKKTKVKIIIYFFQNSCKTFPLGRI